MKPDRCLVVPLCSQLLGAERANVVNLVSVNNARKPMRALKGDPVEPRVLLEFRVSFRAERRRVSGGAGVGSQQEGSASPYPRGSN